MLITSGNARQPIVAIILVIGILIAFGALFLRMQDVLFGEPRGPVGKVRASYVPMFLHLAAVLVAGLLAAGAGRELVPRRRGATRMMVDERETRRAF